MSKTMIIPDVGMDPINLNVNTKAYGPYKAGETAEVPAPVAAMLEQMAETYRKENPSDPDAAPATIGDVKALIWGDGERYELLVEATMGSMEYEEIHGTGFWFGESAAIDLDDGLALAEEMEADDVVLYFNSAANALTKIDPELMACNLELDSEGYPVITGSPAVGLGITKLEGGVRIALYADKDLSGQTVRILRKVEEKSDDAVATIGDVKAMIAEATAPVTIDLSGEDSGITYDAEEDAYFGDASIDWAPMIEACKAGKVMLTDEDENGAFGTAVNGWYTEELNGVDYFVFYGDDVIRPVHLPIPSEEDESEGGLAPLPVIPGGMVSLKLPTANSGE